MIKNKTGTGAPNVMCRFLFFFAQGLIAIQFFIANMLFECCANFLSCDKKDYLPRCQMSRSYSAMVRSEENIPALAMFTRHLRRQPMGSQA